MLRVLHLSSLADSVSEPRLPVEWINENAPLLDTLVARPLALPRTSQCVPLPNITSLEATIYEWVNHWSHVNDLRTLFLVFPRLERLSMEGLTDDGLLPQTPPPPSLKVGYFSSGVINFATLIKAWAPPPSLGAQRNLTFNSGAFPPALAAAATFMAAAQAAPWSMSLQWRGPSYTAYFHRLALGEPEITLISNTPPALQELQELCGSADLAGLQSMKLSGDALVHLLRAEIVFPAIRDLTIADAGAFDASMVRVALAEAVYTQLPLRIPALQSITFEVWRPPVERSGVATVSRLPDLISQCMRFDAVRLQRIVLVQPKAPSADVITSLLEVADRIYLDDGTVSERLEVPQLELPDECIGNVLHTLCTPTE